MQMGGAKYLAMTIVIAVLPVTALGLAYVVPPPLAPPLLSGPVPMFGMDPGGVDHGQEGARA
jgi:hypothetical protein